MANQSSGNDPSMEDILASIRRIIVDDDKSAGASKSAPEADNDDEDVLELTELAEEEEQPAPRPTPKGPTIRNITAVPVKPEGITKDTSPASASAAPVERDQPEDNGAEETMPNPTDSNKDRLVSAQTATSAASALSSLARASDPDPLHGIPKGRPVEALVMDALKPMLSEWLNEHLPAIVERIVEREVRYLARRPEND